MWARRRLNAAIPASPDGSPTWTCSANVGSRRRVSLKPLSREQQAHQISDILGLPPHRQFLDDVYDRAEGNPFFAEELLALAQHGDAGLPTTVRDLLVARLETLTPATRQVLRTASVIGRSVPHRLLDAVVDVSGDRLEGVLRSAVNAHVLRADDGESPSVTPSCKKRSPPACSPARSRGRTAGSPRR